MENHFVGRVSQSVIIPNATKKPIELYMHHFNARSLIVNLKTGDVLTNLFSSDDNSEMKTTSFEHKLFLKQSGEKVLFILKTNHNNLNLTKYIESIKSHGVIFANEIVSNIKGQFSEYEKSQYGEIGAGFVFDLKNPSSFKTYYNLEDGSPITQNAFSVIGNEKSNLLNFEKTIELSYKYLNISNLISWADERLPERLKQSGIDLSKPLNSFDIDYEFEFKDAFSSDHLYTDDSLNPVLKTLIFVKNKGLDPISTSRLCSVAIEKLTTRLVNTYADYNKEEFNRIILMSYDLFKFTKNLLDEQKYDDDLYLECKEELYILNNFSSIISRKVKSLGGNETGQNILFNLFEKILN